MILQVVLALFKRNNRLWPVNFESRKLWNYKEEFCALHALANCLWKCLLSEAFCSQVEKIRTPVLFVTNHPFKRQNTLSLTNELFIKVSAARHSRLELFPSWKSSVYRHTSVSRLWNVYCLLLSNKIWLVAKKIISSSISDNLFIQTVK